MTGVSAGEANEQMTGSESREEVQPYDGQPDGYIR